MVVAPCVPSPSFAGLSLVVALVVGLAAPRRAAADADPAAVPAGERHPMHRSPHTEETERIVGLKPAYALELGRGRGELVTRSLGGLVAFFEQNLLPGFLELEVSTGFFAAPDAFVVPVDLLLKKPFHFGPVCPYVAIGPTATLAWVEEERIDAGESREREVFLGGAVSLGSYFWLSERWGVDVDVTYGLVGNLSAAGRPVHEIVAAAGVGHRF